MSIYYVDPQDSGSTEAGTQAEPFIDLQDAINQIQTDTGAPHTVYCKGTQTLTSDGTAKIDLSTVQNGSVSSGFINIIGVNSDWVDDGTLFVLTGNSNTNGDYGIEGSVQYWKFKNIEVKEMQAAGMYATGQYNIFENCIFHDNTAEGVRNTNHSIFYICSSYNNGAEGFEASGLFIGCRSYSNASDGYNGSDLLCYNCIAHDNGRYGFLTTPNYIGGCFNCVSDNNTSDNYYASNVRSAHVFACRSTNSDAYGINGGSSANWIYEDWNVYLTNASGASTGNVISGSNSVTSGTEGYTNSASDDYTLTSSATYRREAIEIP